jgi:hypothetical protein
MGNKFYENLEEDLPLRVRISTLATTIPHTTPTHPHLIPTEKNKDTH